MADETPTAEPTKSGLMMQSKKAKAYLLGEITWKMIILVTLIIQGMVVYFDKMPTATIALGFIGLQTGIVLVAGFLEVSYIGKQGDLDKFLGLAKIASKSGMSVKTDGTLKAPDDNTPD
jgi:hypothetical protein